MAAPRVSLMRSYYTLSDYPHEMVEIEWAKCGRHGRLRTAQLLAEHGPDIKLLDLLGVIAQCPKWGSMSDACEAQYSPASQIDAALPLEADISATADRAHLSSTASQIGQPTA